jgi:hypothetical protein
MRNQPRFADARLPVQHDEPPAPAGKRLDPLRYPQPLHIPAGQQARGPAVLARQLRPGAPCGDSAGGILQIHLGCRLERKIPFRSMPGRGIAQHTPAGGDHEPRGKVERCPHQPDVPTTHAAAVPVENPSRGDTDRTLDAPAAQSVSDRLRGMHGPQRIIFARRQRQSERGEHDDPLVIHRQARQRPAVADMGALDCFDDILQLGERAVIRGVEAGNARKN